MDIPGCCHNPAVPTGQPAGTGFEPDPGYGLYGGVLSRDGWSIIDDSQTPAVDPAPEPGAWPWINTTRSPQLDLYVFACGGARPDEYRACLADYTALTGPIGLPPPSALGVWWSRHWGSPSTGQPFGPMTAGAVRREVVEAYHEHGLPLDMLVLDMEWHQQVLPPDCMAYVGLKGWAGWTWNATLFPDPAGFHAWVRGPGNALRLLLNIHPDSNYTRCEVGYAAFARALGMDPAKGAAIELDTSNRTVMEAYFGLVVAAMDADYMWVDSRTVTTWKNGLYDDALRRQGKRPLALSRWGGLGSHRYAHGFSGDSLRRWDTLRYEVWMTPQAANVGFGWWSHDVGGFSGAGGNDTLGESPELNLRWLQAAVFLPIFRAHCRYCDQRIFAPPLSTSGLYPYLAAALRRRNRLLPYVASQGWRAHVSGVSVVHPVYYMAPGSPRAYAYSLQYCFGDDMLIAPVTSPVDPGSNTTAALDVWLPPGTWMRWAAMATVTTSPSPDGVVLKGSASPYGLAETPVWVKLGAVVPTRGSSALHTPVADAGGYDPLVWMIWAGAGAHSGDAGPAHRSARPELCKRASASEPTSRSGSDAAAACVQPVLAGSGFLFEDDGSTNAFETGAYRLTAAAFNLTLSGTQAAGVLPRLEVTLAPGEGAYTGMILQRNVSLQVPGWQPAAGLDSVRITLNGAHLPRVPPLIGVPGPGSSERRGQPRGALAGSPSGAERGWWLQAADPDTAEPTALVVSLGALPTAAVATVVVSG